MMRILAATARLINQANEALGRFVSWLSLLMVITTFAVVILRYAFSIGYVWMQESYVWMHGMLFMLGAAFTLKHDGHVRVDLFYQKAGHKMRAWINLIGTLFFLFPFVGVLGWTSYPYIRKSWNYMESSQQAGGLPALYLLKTVIAVFCILMALQGVSILLRCVLELRGRQDLISQYGLSASKEDHPDV